MDALSSQANLAGYRAVIEAAEAYGKAFPMMMTAAGTVAPAKVFVMGVGVAGLQAIATARRLGGVVSATDVRPATKEQVESLGAKFLAVEDEEFKNAQTAGGYAKEMSADYKAKQAALVTAHIAKQDIVITTALIPGRAAPILVTKDQVASMKPGSVLIDLAAPQGGNVEGCVADEVVDVGGVRIIGLSNITARIATDASALYAKNLQAFVGLLITKDGALTPDAEDEILKAALVTQGGAVVHPSLKSSFMNLECVWLPSITNKKPPSGMPHGIRVMRAPFAAFMPTIWSLSRRSSPGPACPDQRRPVRTSSPSSNTYRALCRASPISSSSPSPTVSAPRATPSSTATSRVTSSPRHSNTTATASSAWPTPPIRRRR